MPDLPTLVAMVSPACHARPENIKKEQVLELFRPWLKKQIGIKARADKLSTSQPMSKIKERKVTRLG
ncbi:MAG: hypothetical protein JRI72_03810 [Deltaproteobacteria bacterium]|nr:hypothetical protein [Deltaproteobacteria bacterium]